MLLSACGRSRVWQWLAAHLPVYTLGLSVAYSCRCVTWVCDAWFVCAPVQEALQQTTRDYSKSGSPYGGAAEMVKEHLAEKRQRKRKGTSNASEQPQSKKKRSASNHRVPSDIEDDAFTVRRAWMQVKCHGHQCMKQIRQGAWRVHVRTEIPTPASSPAGGQWKTANLSFCPAPQCYLHPSKHLVSAWSRRSQSGVPSAPVATANMKMELVWQPNEPEPTEADVTR